MFNSIYAWHIWFYINYLTSVKCINIIQPNRSRFYINICYIYIGYRNRIWPFRGSQCEYSDFIRAVPVWLFFYQCSPVRCIVATIHPPENLHMTVSLKPL